MRSLPAALLLFALACRTGPPATVRPISESEWFANAEECALNSDSLSTATTLFLEDREMAPSIEAVRVLDSELHRTEMPSPARAGSRWQEWRARARQH